MTLYSGDAGAIISGLMALIGESPVLDVTIGANLRSPTAVGFEGELIFAIRSRRGVLTCYTSFSGYHLPHVPELPGISI